MSASEITLTPDLLEYARAVALKELQKRCPPSVSYDDVLQEVMLKLLSKPPKFDPERGASEKTLIYTVVYRLVLKCMEREYRQRRRHKQVVDLQPEAEDSPKERQRVEQEGRDRTADLEAHAVKEEVEGQQDTMTELPPVLEDIFDFIHDDKSRDLCLRVIECNGNVSKVAEEMELTEGAVRYRLKMLKPKLLKADFDPSEYL